MREDSINQILLNTLNQMFISLASFIPRFISGLIVLLLGIVLASIVRHAVVELLKFLKLDVFVKKYGALESKNGVLWSNLIAELLRWFVIILFLIPVSDVWGLTRFVDVLNGLVGYLPSVFISVLILLVGTVVARLVYETLLASIHGISKQSATTIATVGKWSVIVFVILVVLNQLGIASDLIRILFTGFVAMIALAGGLAFGLGGREVAKEILEKLAKKLQ